MSRTEADDQRSEDQANAVDQIRTVLADGFSFVRSQEVVASVSAITFEELLDRARAVIEVDESDVYPGRLTVVRQLKQRVDDAVDRALEMPAELFEYNGEQGSANTDVDGGTDD
jgi:hypothetical protein